MNGAGGTYDGPGNLALDPVGGLIYAADWYGTRLYEIASDGSEVLDSVVIGTNLWQLVVDPLGRYVYVTDRGPDVVRVIDLDTLTEVRAVAVGTDPWGIDVTLDGSKLVVACEDDHTARIINTADWTSVSLLLNSAADPRDVDILDAAGYAFIAGGQISGGNPVYVVDLATDTLKDTILIPSSNTNVIAVQEQTTSALTGVPEQDAGIRLDLACYPNPFNPAATVRYMLPGPASSRLTVHDVSGRLVAVLEPVLGEGGLYEARWDGRDESGAVVATGVYFVRLETEYGAATGKVTMVR
jgi:YVTN family beta-propeller protein